MPPSKSKSKNGHSSFGGQNVRSLLTEGGRETGESGSMPYTCEYRAE